MLFQYRSRARQIAAFGNLEQQVGAEQVILNIQQHRRGVFGLKAQIYELFQRYGAQCKLLQIYLQQLKRLVLDTQFDKGNLSLIAQTRFRNIAKLRMLKISPVLT